MTTPSGKQAAAIANLLRRAGLSEREVQRRTSRALAAGLTQKPSERKPTESRNTHDENQ